MTITGLHIAIAALVHDFRELRERLWCARCRKRILIAMYADPHPLALLHVPLCRKCISMQQVLEVALSGRGYDSRIHEDDEEPEEGEEAEEPEESDDEEDGDEEP